MSGLLRPTTNCVTCVSILVCGNAAYGYLALRWLTTHSQTGDPTPPQLRKPE